MGEVTELRGAVAVVTGGAGGIGRGIVEALLEEGARVVIADVERPVLDRTVAELAGRGEVSGVWTDVSDYEAVDALAELVFERYGVCNLLFNNAGVTSGGGGKPWEQEANDWRWCFSVNVFGVANGMLAFVPRMLASGAPGVIVNTSSGDGGIAPVPYASVYAASKAAVTCLTEAFAHQLADSAANVRAAVFYPSGGLLDTGLWTAARNRPAELARTKPRPPAPGTTFEEFREQLRAMGRNAEVMDLRELGRFVVRGVKAGSFVIHWNLDEVQDLLHARADAIGKGELPPHALV
jgi:NAD(P)-dependent dehydrogenase (short-subunit alcohol dehydrogenase family)